MPAAMAVDTVGMAAMVMLAEATAEMGAEEAAAMEAEVAAAGAVVAAAAINAPMPQTAMTI
jgi:hypothetical protein